MAERPVSRGEPHNLIERLEAAAKGAQHARDIDIRVEHPYAAYPYLEILGAAAGQLSLREAGAWATYLGAIKPKDILALLGLARATDALVAIDCESLPEEAVAGPDGRCVICTVRAAREPLFCPEVPSCPSQG